MKAMEKAFLLIKIIALSQALIRALICFFKL
ncbi:hypothetical protein CY0110_00985 [Crocosphaera chwakensis CCY0110]|uniref:Uncharacterized protein n=1 Tax=Crocosphaera chwakensis CCY0110 TaxID=391612 RepID=A3IZV6_9CHRO|nr:hypothetical protein CY0110_00985 [Crocosphaera chwakensis CCY0110]